MNELPDEAIVSALLKDLSGLLAKPELMDEGLVGAAEGTQHAVSLREGRNDARPQRLLSKQVHQRLLARGALDDAGLGGADGPAQRQRHAPCAPRPVLLHRREARESRPAHEA